MTFSNYSLDYFTCIEMESIDSATLTSSYQAINTGFDNDIKIMVIANTSSNWISISYDGTNLADMIPPNTRVPVDLQTNHACNSSYSSGTLTGRKGQIVYAKGTASAGVVAVGGYR